MNLKMELVKFLVRLGEGVARLGKGRLRLGEYVTVRDLCSWPVMGRFRGLVCDCLWLASRPSLFESVIA